MKKRIFVTGHRGLLGSEICQRIMELENFELHVPSPKFDLSDMMSVWKELMYSEVEYDAIIHCAAVVDVDAAELNPSRAYDVNTKGTAVLAEICRNMRIPMVFISTDYVFAGKSTEIAEWEDTNPLNIYGMTKATAEEIVQYFLPGQHVILRTAGLYGKGVKGYVPHVISSLLTLSQDAFAAPTHRVFQPTSVRHLSLLAIESLASLKLGLLDAGIYHATGRGAATHMDVAKVILKHMRTIDDRYNGIEIVRDPDWADKTRRPSCSILGHSAWATTDINPMNPWEVDLRHDLPSIIEAVKERMP